MRIHSSLSALVALVTVVGSLQAQQAVNPTGKRCSTKLLPDDGAVDDFFGQRVAISGTTAIAGAHGDDDNGSWSGSAYLFDLTTGQQFAKLKPDDGAAGDHFGYGVAISGTTAVVGAYGADAAYVFDVTTGQQLVKLQGPSGSSFGVSVAISGTTAVVGAKEKAYVFDVTTGQHTATLSGDYSDWPWDWFGHSVAISGTTAIVGALFDDDYGTDSGSAYLFDVTTGQRISKLLPDSGEWLFGRSVAISGTTAVVGARNSAYVFDATTGLRVDKLYAEDSEAGDAFGLSVAISGTTAVVGAPRDRVNGNYSGSSYLFDVTTGQQIAKLLPDDGAKWDEFGHSVAISGTTAFVGAPGDRDNGLLSGSSYLFEECLRFGTGYCWTHPNSSGSPASISGRGSDVVADNDLTLITRHCPQNEVGYYMMSATQGFVSDFGGSDGNLCLGGTIVRFADDVLSSGPEGTFVLQPDLTNLPDNTTFLPGETWNFQLWFRDGSASNTSDGLAVTFH